MLHSAIYRVLYMVTQFVTSIIIANVLLPSNWGDLSLFYINAGIISLITGFGADSLIIHSLTNNKWNVGQALYFLWRLTLLQIIVFAFIELVFFFWQGSTILSLDKESNAILELLYFIGLILTEKYIGLFYSLNKAKLANIFLFVHVLIFLIVFVLINRVVNISYRIVLTAVCVQVFLQGSLLCLFFHLRVHRLIFKRIVRPIFLTSLKLSSIVMVTNCIQFIAYRVDFYLLEKYYSNYEVGIYAQANKFANLIWIVPNIFALLVTPKFTEIKKEELPILFRLASVMNVIILVITTLVTNVFYAYFLDISYKPGLKSFYIMLTGYFLFSLMIYLAAYISWLGKFHYNLIGSSFCLLVIFFFDLLFIPGWALNGAALANTLAYSLTFLLYFFILFHRSPFSIKDFFLFKKTDLLFLLKLIK